MRWIDDAQMLHDDCAVVFHTRDEFGALSNMASGYDLIVAGIPVRSSEALYQALRFPHCYEWQREILNAPTPMQAKMMAKKDGRRDHHSRADWHEIRVPLMRWVLRLKVEQHPTVAARLLATNGRPVVERSSKDTEDHRFWGAVFEEDQALHGNNQLGRLLMELRDALVAGTELAPIAPLPEPHTMRLLGCLVAND